MTSTNTLGGSLSSRLGWAVVLSAALLPVLSGCYDTSSFDVCAHVDCSGHGTCVGEIGGHLCLCDEGYHEDGQFCVPDGADGDADVDVDADADAEVDADQEQAECEDGREEDCGPDTDVGVCEIGTRTCVDGEWGECVGAVYPSDEVCDEAGFDEDCDTSANEGCECTDGETRVCGTDVGPCVAGLQTCRDGVMSECEGSVDPTDETCNGIDDDCDDEVDEGENACGGVCELDNAPGAACDGDDSDLCEDDAYECTSLSTTACSLGPGNAEDCNGVDDDCDGDIDEDCTAPGVTTARFPWNGYATGSVYASSSLRPSFRWEEVAAATDYQIQVDDTCTTAGFLACAFPSPEIDTVVAATSFTPGADLAVSVSQPVGRRYYWRVRSCRGEACSAWTSIRYMDVGRMTQDFNGDGYADVVVGASAQGNPEAGEGNAFVFYGSAAGIPTTPATTLDNPADQAMGRFGISVASAGDVNGDGYADVVVGADYQDNPEGDEGTAFVFHGSATGISTTPATTLDNPANQAMGSFGVSVTSAGDVNGDGYADVVVGASAQDSPEAGEGNAFVFLGSAAGISATPATTLDNPADQANGRFGVSVASAGDVNGDGYADVVVGAELQDNPENDEGNAFVFHGSAAGILSTAAISLDNPDDQADGRFGVSVASAGDVNSDGYADIVVGAYRQSSPENDEGNVFVFHGSAAGISSTPSTTLDNPDDQTSGYFGYSVASAGDINDDGYDDIIVGAYYQSVPESTEGNAFVFHGSAAGISATPATTLDNPDDQTGGCFGYSVASAGDVNGDGYADIIVGAYGQDDPEVDEGNAFVFHGSAAGISATPATTLDNPDDQARSRFGVSVASAFDQPLSRRRDLLFPERSAACLPRRSSWLSPAEPQAVL